MNSGQSSTQLNDMLTEFVNYVYSFYGDKKDACYPLFNVDTDKQVDKVDILGAVYDYLHEITCLLYTSPSPRDVEESRMPSSA